MSGDDSPWVPGAIEPIVARLRSGDVSGAATALADRYLRGSAALGQEGLNACLELLGTLPEMPHGVLDEVRVAIGFAPDEIPMVIQLTHGDVAEAIESLRARFLYSSLAERIPPGQRRDNLVEFLRRVWAAEAASLNVLNEVRIEATKPDSSFLPPILWHFTSASNIPSIRSYGLISASECRRRNISPTYASDETSRATHGVGVHLCLDADHPMRGKAELERGVRDIVWLKVDTRVVDRSLVTYYETNAVRKNPPVRHGPDPRIARSGDRQAEVLVHGSIPVDLVTFPAAS